ncbi:MAG: putative transcriptional regulator [Modestobacter sp.]|nr:putative transcriptional regulator [Modestobacter sp.]
MTLRCLIVDDSPRFLDAVRVLLERQGFTVVGVASTSAAALEQAVELRPDVTLVDINLDNENGFELVRQLCGTGSPPTSSVILISAQGEQDYADLIAESPAAGFLSKPTLSAGAIFMLRGTSDGDPQGPLSEPR